MAAEEQRVDEVVEEADEEDVMGTGTSKQAAFGLTSSDKKIITKTWAIIKKDLGKNGIALFSIFLTNYKQHSKYFNFTNKEDLELDPTVKLHGIRVLREVSAIVDNIDKPEVLVYALTQNAMNHRKRRISKAAYDDLKVSFVSMIIQQLGPEKGTEEVATTWDKALTIVFKVITDLNDEGKCSCGNKDKSSKDSPNEEKKYTWLKDVPKLKDTKLKKN